ncbi:MAG: hypothetical protein M1832_002971 [Thelocarpon impressellum]|nr:MAG: hypothetical protein M1832_002971 [Thelocarpon impressellum]
MARTKKNKPGSVQRAAKKASLAAAEKASLAAAETFAPASTAKQAADEMSERPTKRAKKSGSSSNAAPRTEPAKVTVEAQAAETRLSSDALDGQAESPDDEHAPVLHAHPELDKTHNLVSINVISSSKIANRVTLILSALSSFTFADPSVKPGLVIVNAKAPVASKAISVIEIAKREIASKGQKWYQYTTLNQLMQTLPEKKAVKAKGDLTIAETDGLEADGDRTKDAGEGSDEEAFEHMDTDRTADAESGRKKVRAVPRINVYLSMVRVEPLKELYG